MTAKTLDLSDFHGSECLYRNGGAPGLNYTEGVQYVAETAEAYWLLTLIATEFNPLQKTESFIHLVLTIPDNGRNATLAADDGNGNPLHSCAISWTDFPPGTWRFYLIDNVLMLPSEY